MKGWLNARTANRAAWAVIALLVLVPALLGGYLLLERGQSLGTSDEPVPTGVRVDVIVTDTAPPAGTTRRPKFGTIDQVEGRALVVRLGTGEMQRVLLRDDGPVTMVTSSTGVATITPGEPVFVQMSEPRPDSLLATRLVIAPAGDQLPDELCHRAGTVTAIEGQVLVYQSRCGEQRIALARDVNVTRFAPGAVTDLRAGQRVTFTGELLADGTVSAAGVQVTESR
ncbi:MAG: hypothetical protein ACRDJE_28375 [Dehalococcoidia bacterium]